MAINFTGDEVSCLSVCYQEFLIILDIPDVGGFQLDVLCAVDVCCSIHDDIFVIWYRVICVEELPFVVTNPHSVAIFSNDDRPKAEFINHVVQGGIFCFHYPCHLIFQVVDVFWSQLARDWCKFGIPLFHEPRVKFSLSTHGVVLF